jgi:hypothetical protein
MNALGPKTFDPKEAIENRLRFYASRARPCVPNMATLRFLKARVLPAHQLHPVTFEDTAGQLWYSTFFLSQREDGSWYVKTAGGSGDHEQVAPSAIQDRPWVHLGGGQQTRLPGRGSLSYEFLAGGEVMDQGFDIVRVRLLGPNGHVLEDTVQDGLVLFWSDQYIGMPLQAELSNRAGEVVSSHSVLTFPSPESLSAERFRGSFRPLP